MSNNNKRLKNRNSYVFFTSVQGGLQPTRALGIEVVLLKESVEFLKAISELIQNKASDTVWIDDHSIVVEAIDVLVKKYEEGRWF